MSDHAGFSEDLPLYALGALPPSDPARLRIQTHLESCSACQMELAEFRSAAALLALSVDMQPAPKDARHRLLASIARENKDFSSSSEVRNDSSLRRPWWAFAPILGTAVLAIFAVMLWRDNGEMRLQLESAKAELQRAQVSADESKNNQELATKAKNILDLLTSPESLRVEVVATGVTPRPHGKAIYNAAQGTLVFVAGNLDPLPAQRAYELWLLPKTGSQPVAIGVFKPDAQGNATLLMPSMPIGIAAKNFAVTVEPAAGSPAPTSAIMMVGE